MLRRPEKLDLDDLKINVLVILAQFMAKDKVDLTKEWIMLMLYGSARSRQSLIADGCRVMVYGHDFEDLVKIFDILHAQGFIEGNSKEYRLSEKGTFYIKKNTLLPLITLAENRKTLNEFIQKYKEQCDTEFLTQLSNKTREEDKITTIKIFAKQNYDKIAVILTLILGLVSSG